MKTPVSVLGTGRMGSALARTFIEKGYPTTVWNRTNDKAVPLGALGAAIAETVHEAIEAADIVVINVSDYDASASLLYTTEAANALRGKLIVQLTSGTPQGAREAAQWAEAQGANYLDGAILATPNLIGTKECVILLSGPDQVFDANKKALFALGGKVRHVGEDFGVASTLDSAALSQMWGGLFGALHAIALCQAEQVDLMTLASQWTDASPVVDGLVSDLMTRTHDARFASDQDTLSSVSVHYEALQHVIELMHARNLDRTLVDAYDGVFKRAIAAGHLHDDFAVMSQFMRQPTGLPRVQES